LRKTKQNMNIKFLPKIKIRLSIMMIILDQLILNQKKSWMNLILKIKI